MRTLLQRNGGLVEMRIAILCLLCVAFSSSPSASASSKAENLRVRIVNPGIYSAHNTGRFSRTKEGAVFALDDVKMIRETTSIPLRKGLRFGLRYQIVGDSELYRQPHIRMALRVPVGGLRNPNTGQTVHSFEYVLERPVQAYGHRVFHLDEDWELVPGRWTFEFWYVDKKLGEQEFCLYVEGELKDAAANASDACVGPTS